MRRIWGVTTAALLSLPFGSQSGGTGRTPPGTPAEMRMASAQATFGFRLFSNLTTDEPTGNVFISPSSVAFALAMTWNGAAGETREAMGRVLELQGMSREEVNQASLALKNALQQGDPAVQLHIANSLWARKGLEFRPDFMSRNREFFQAEITALNFADRTAASTINDWVSRNTAGKIPRIIDQIDSNAILFLLNAIYFKGKWTNQFRKELTTQKPFMLSPGSPIQVPMMTQSGSYQYFETPDFQAISLPYGNRRWNLRIFLPSPGRGLPAFLKSLAASSWDNWMSSFRKRDGDISLPRFRIEYETRLNDALKALGMEAAFNQSRADFSAMVQQSERAYINEVKHKTFVEVNEEGTEAAAATSVGVSLASVQTPTERFRMVVDRPFFCAIRDDQTGAVLFLGAINHPK